MKTFFIITLILLRINGFSQTYSIVVNDPNDTIHLFDVNNEDACKKVLCSKEWMSIGWSERLLRFDSSIFDKIRFFTNGTFVEEYKTITGITKKVKGTWQLGKPSYIIGGKKDNMREVIVSTEPIKYRLFDGTQLKGGVPISIPQPILDRSCYAGSYFLQLN